MFKCPGILTAFRAYHKQEDADFAHDQAIMGLKGYFKAPKKEDAAHHGNVEFTEKQPPLEVPVPIEPSSTPLGPYEYAASQSSDPSRASIVPSEDSKGSDVTELKEEIRVNYLFQRQCAARWIGDGAGEREGVVIRKSKNSFIAFPPSLTESVFGQACIALNLPSAMTVNSRVIKTFLSWSPNAVDVPLKNGLRVQVVPTMEDLISARKMQFAAFVAKDGLLVVWDDGW